MKTICPHVAPDKFDVLVIRRGRVIMMNRDPLTHSEACTMRGKQSDATAPYAVVWPHGLTYEGYLLGGKP